MLILKDQCDIIENRNLIYQYVENFLVFSKLKMPHQRHGDEHSLELSASKNGCVWAYMPFKGVTNAPYRSMKSTPRLVVV